MANSYLNKTGLQRFYNGIKTKISSKQDTLVSGTNIKTVNNQSLLGSGNITISGGSATFGYTKISALDSAITGGDTLTINLGNYPYNEIIIIFTCQDLNEDVVQIIGTSSTIANIPIFSTLNGVTGSGCIHLVKLGNRWVELSGNYFIWASSTLTIQLQDQQSTTECDVSVYGR